MTTEEPRSLRDRLADANLLEVLTAIAFYLASRTTAQLGTDPPAPARTDVEYWRSECARRRARREELESEITNAAALKAEKE